MKLKNKLIISFLMIMAIPLFLFCVFSVVLVRYQFVTLCHGQGRVGGIGWIGTVFATCLVSIEKPVL